MLSGSTHTLRHPQQLQTEHGGRARVVCVGNVQWGGTGKTPMARWIASSSVVVNDGMAFSLLSGLLTARLAA